MKRTLQDDNDMLQDLKKRRQGYDMDVEIANKLEVQIQEVEQKLSKVEEKLIDYIKNLSTWVTQQTTDMLNFARDTNCCVIATIGNWHCCNVHLVKVNVLDVEHIETGLSIKVKLIGLAESQNDIYCDGYDEPCPCVRGQKLWDALISGSDEQTLMLSARSINSSSSNHTVEDIRFKSKIIDWISPENVKVKVQLRLHSFYLVAFKQLIRYMFDCPTEIASIIATYYHDDHKRLRRYEDY